MLKTMKHITALLVLSLALLNNFVSGGLVNSSLSVIPTRAEQVNLLINVQEVFEQVKLLTEDEAHSTNISVSEDVELMVERAEYVLDLLHQIIQLRLSREANTVCSLDARPVIKQLTYEGKEALRNCTLLTIDDISVTSDKLAYVTEAAIDRSQLLLDALRACAKKLGMAVISCYKRLIDTDVVPVKNVLIGAIEAHKSAHFRALEIRKVANACVDDTVDKYRVLMEESLDDAKTCDV